MLTKSQTNEIKIDIKRTLPIEKKITTTTMKFQSAPLIAVIGGSLVSASDAWNNQGILFASPFQDVACRSSSLDDSSCSPFSRMIREQEKMFDRELAKMDRDFSTIRRGGGRRGMMMDLLEKQKESFLPSNRYKYFGKIGQGQKIQYDITSTDEEIKIALDVPGITADNIDVSVDSDTRMLTISGKREVKDEEYSFSSKFTESFYLNPTIDIKNFTAKLQDGVLVIRAPKTEVETSVRRIPIESAASTTSTKQEEVEVPISIATGKDDDSTKTKHVTTNDEGVKSNENVPSPENNDGNDDEGEVIELSDV
jgi:HSP20 family molecular chaperone IbpA